MGVPHEVTAYYPNLSDPAGTPAHAYPAFRSFCLEHREAIEALVTARLVQTNEVRRCACLLPAFCQVSRLAKGRPLAFVEIGASAGLNLLWDRYGYRYGEDLEYGDSATPVQIECTPRGQRRLPILATFPDVVFRVGLDLNPIDVSDPDAALWLRALVWPEHAGRAVLLQRAIAVAREAPPPLIAGDAVELLQNVLLTVPEEAALCIYHTHTLNQFSPEARERLASLLADHAPLRDLCVVSMEGCGGDPPVSRLDLVSYERGMRTERHLALCSGHGDWIEWREESARLVPRP
jgi:hypothetical protein